MLEDHVEHRLSLGSLGRSLGGAMTRRMLKRMFNQRHEQTCHDLERHGRYADRGPQRVLISGASGLIGGALCAFLSAGGHQVERLVRRAARAGASEVCWRPTEGEVDAGALEGADVIIHLAGESIAGGRWSEARKQRILTSRAEGTRLLSEAIAGLERPPRALISASAIGYYGDVPAGYVDESAAPGEGFLAEVCQAWEAACEPARQAGVRVVNPRLGVVLAASGGALAKMLTPFKLGVGGRLGSGAQGMSWVALDDVVGAVHHLMFADDVAGAVNMTAPNPVDNATFTRVLGRVLGRPTLIPVPAFAVKALFGEMGERLLLEGARVLPRRLERSGFAFLYPELEGALRAELGREAQAA